MGWIIRLLLAFAGGVGVATWLNQRRSRPVVRVAPADLVIEPPLPVGLVRIDGGSLAVHWQRAADNVTIYAGNSFATINREKPVARVSGVQEVVIPDIDPQHRSYLELVFDGQESVQIAERTLPFTSLANVRDIGGYPTTDGRVTRWDKVYRSVAPTFMSPEDIARLESLSVRLICDLRSDEEVEQAPTTPPASVREVLRLPVQSEVSRLERIRFLLFDRHRLQDLLRRIYIDILIDNNPQLFGRILHALAIPDNLPALIHCTAGKDRTGVAIALLLRLLNVPEEIVVADYSLSNDAYSYLMQSTADAVRPLLTLGLTENDIQPLLAADPDLMRATLHHVETKYGGVEAYLRQHAGLDHATISALKDNLLD